MNQEEHLTLPFDTKSHLFQIEDTNLDSVNLDLEHILDDEDSKMQQQDEHDAEQQLLLQQQQQQQQQPQPSLHQKFQKQVQPRQRLRPWMIDQIHKGDIPGLEWLDRDE